MVVNEQKTGALATGAMIAAILGFVFTFAGHPFFGLFSALLSIPLGVMGLMMSASPRVGGGLLSIAALVLGVIAIGVAVLGGIGAVIF
ncbi:hypothetical protein [Geobacter sp. DSM 9736]|uniref:hypothetical protein n=1 Tax=Geobacter sp. DSM 9736 TaxID=1277350 RepID=UPI000B50C5B3|nr:hypothetical protein [Geobacter sp. DSM 9736]SNB45230.1 hypothetical protein SAMN06269301_0633 [Geobacter sp. DSM 9736]